MKSIREIYTNRIQSVSVELKRFTVALEDVQKEHAATTTYTSPSRKMAKARRASLDLATALTEFRKSIWAEARKQDNT